MHDGGFTTLISPDQLSSRLGQPGWAIFDCRFDLADTEKGERAYRAGHIPGAVYAHLDRHLSGPITPASGRHPLPDSEVFQRWLGGQGISNSSQVVAYDDSGGSMAVRLWWLLRWLGHYRVAVLDGGWPGWIAAGLPVTRQIVAPRHATFSGVPDTSMVVTTQSLLAADAGLQLVDMRTAERFRAEQEPIDPVAGHIPGAVNLPLQRHLRPDGRFLPPAELLELYRPLTRDRQPEELVFMCGSGVTACHGILAMAVAGLPGARVYAGSWSEWIRDPARPVATGAEPGEP